MEKTFFQRLLGDRGMATFKRAFRVFIFGALTTIGLVTVAQPTTWKELGTILATFALAGIWGGITAVISGVDKWLRWKN